MRQDEGLSWSTELGRWACPAGRAVQLWTPSIHVLWQVPRTSEIYIHRSGRTARAASEGLSLMLIGPEDVINFKKIYKTLKKDEDIPLFPVQSKYMDAVKVKVKLHCTVSSEHLTLRTAVLS